jgi:hypothetical protein
MVCSHRLLSLVLVAIGVGRRMSKREWNEMKCERATRWWLNLTMWKATSKKQSRALIYKGIEHHQG